MKKITFIALCCILCFLSHAENGYRLWLRYDKIDDPSLLSNYRKQTTDILVTGNSTTVDAIRSELEAGLTGLLDTKVNFITALAKNATVIAGTPNSSQTLSNYGLQNATSLGREGYSILTKNIQGKNCILIIGNTDVAVLYGTFHFLRLIQTHASLQNLSITSVPKLACRMLDHWDNLDRTVERGYAGFSLWNWHQLPDIIEQRYIDYARANASVGINGTVLTNVNANAQILTPEYITKVAALANVFRKYGIKVYLTARFSAPVEIGGLKTADPLDEQVKKWWAAKADEIYAAIPDFGGFLVKANSEGQPGPQNYGRNHVDGANMLADVVAKHQGIIMWRAFVYSSDTPEDRFKQAYTEFKPLDGQFRDNVLIQVKNGPLDFQPREPFHPLFGAMPNTQVMPEFQLTQEYLGFATHLVYLAPLFKECLASETYVANAKTTVSGIIEQTSPKKKITGMAGVANIGNDVDWCGHPFGQANWYTFGKLAWNPEANTADMATDWIKMTFTNNPAAVNSMKQMMLGSREAMVNYMTPLGLHHIMGYGHHYGPAPWYDKAPRADWNPVYFHKADTLGIGFDRTVKGTNALAQYPTPIQQKFEDLNTCPENLLLWFHHVPWNHKMHDGRSFWDELCLKYYEGVDSVRRMQKTWQTMKGQIDKERFAHVEMLLAVQEKEAVWWRNACLLYFQTFSKMPIPRGLEQPNHNLEYYKALKFSHVPGNG